VATHKMHDDEIEISAELVRRLLAEQFPRWANLSIVRVTSAGTDNAMFRLGDELLVRLPRIPWAISQVEREHRWLPELAPHLPLAIPTPLARGEPGDGYPWPWSVYGWLEGETATIDRIRDPDEAARELAGFVRAMHAIDPAGGPPGGRGEPLATRDEEVRGAIADLEGMIDTRPAVAAWDEALRVPEWDGPPMWLHGDLLSQNLLAVDGRLCAVIDWGGVGVGDPACDAAPAWTYLRATSRDVFREALAVDDATWARGRGWALCFGLVALPYYVVTNPVLAGIARQAVEAVLDDSGGNAGGRT
jgi:aminoglycoside phosphotransferase (APT) family kinase protein